MNTQEKNGKSVLSKIFLYGLMLLMLLGFGMALVPDPGHSAADIGDGTFAGGNYVFPVGSKLGVAATPTSDLTVKGGVCVTPGTPSCSTASGGDVEIEDGSLCIGESGCTPSLTDGQLVVERGACIGSIGVSCLFAPADGDLQVPDGSVCVASGGCNPDATNGHLYIGSTSVASPSSTEAPILIGTRSGRRLMLYSGGAITGTAQDFSLIAGNDIYLQPTSDIFLQPTGMLFIGTATSSTDAVLRDGSMCIGSNDCSAPSTYGQLVIETGMCVGSSAAGGMCSTPLDGNVEIEDGSVCIGIAGCSPPVGKGRLIVDDTIEAQGQGSSGIAVYATTSGGTGIGQLAALNYGVVGSSTTSGFAGVYGINNAARGYGVYGASTGGDAGHFEGNVSVTNRLIVSGLCGGVASCNEDLAEYMHARKAEAGDVVEIADDGAIVPTSTAYSHRAVGVVSTNPSLILPAGDVEAATGRPLALSGIVPVKATDENGAIKPGDLLVSSSTPGHAMRCDDRKKCYGAVIGKAMTPLHGKKGTVDMIVMLG